MPINRVIPRPVTTRGKVRWRVIIPIALTNGKRTVRWFRTKGAAEKYARTVETHRAANLGGYDSLSLQDRALVTKAIARAGSVDNLMRAVDFFVLHNTKEVRTVAALALECYQDRTRSRFSKKYLNNFSNTLRRFYERFEKREAHTITTDEISQWLHSFGWAAITMSGNLKDIRTLFNFALGRKYVSQNPALAVTIPKVTAKAPGILTVDETERLLRAAERLDRGLIPILALILFGGLRPTEAEACRMEFIKGDIIDLPAGLMKNNKRRLIDLAQLPPTLKAWLGTAVPLPGLQRALNLIKRMRALRKATVPEVHWSHDVLRHSFVSYAVPIFGIAQTGLLADHSESVLKKHYRELVRRSEAEKFWKIMPSQ